MVNVRLVLSLLSSLKFVVNQVFLGLQRYYGSLAVQLEVELAFYAKNLLQNSPEELTYSTRLSVAVKCSNVGDVKAVEAEGPSSE